MLRRLESRRECGPLSDRPQEVSEGSIDGAPAADKAPGALPRWRESAKRRGARSTRSRRCAVKRAAVGGRMTERWSGRARGGGGDTPLRGRSRSRRAAGFPRSPAGSLQKGCSRRVLVVRTSVVEVDSRHLGDATEVSRKAQRGRSVERHGRRPVWTRPGDVPLAEGCQKAVSGSPRASWSSESHAEMRERFDGAGRESGRAGGTQTASRTRSRRKPAGVSLERETGRPACLMIEPIESMEGAWSLEPEGP